MKLFHLARKFFIFLVAFIFVLTISSSTSYVFGKKEDKNNKSKVESKKEEKKGKEKQKKLIRENNKHIKWIAQIDRIEELGRKDKADKLRELENKRHEKALKRIEEVEDDDDLAVSTGLMVAKKGGKKGGKGKNDQELAVERAKEYLNLLWEKPKKTYSLWHPEKKNENKKKRFMSRMRQIGPMYQMFAALKKIVPSIGTVKVDSIKSLENNKFKIDYTITTPGDEMLDLMQKESGNQLGEKKKPTPEAIEKAISQAAKNISSKVKKMTTGTESQSIIMARYKKTYYFFEDAQSEAEIMAGKRQKAEWKAKSIIEDAKKGKTFFCSYKEAVDKLKKLQKDAPDSKLIKDGLSLVTKLSTEYNKNVKKIKLKVIKLDLKSEFNNLIIEIKNESKKKFKSFQFTYFLYDNKGKLLKQHDDIQIYSTENLDPPAYEGCPPGYVGKKSISTINNNVDQKILDKCTKIKVEFKKISFSE